MMMVILRRVRRSEETDDSNKMTIPSTLARNTPISSKRAKHELRPKDRRDLAKLKTEIAITRALRIFFAKGSFVQWDEHGKESVRVHTYH
jgi:hypothetical protein